MHGGYPYRVRLISALVSPARPEAAAEYIPKGKSAENASAGICRAGADGDRRFSVLQGGGTRVGISGVTFCQSSKSLKPFDVPLAAAGASELILADVCEIWGAGSEAESAIYGV